MVEQNPDDSLLRWPFLFLRRGLFVRTLDTPAC